MKSSEIISSLLFGISVLFVGIDYFLYGFVGAASIIKLLMLGLMVLGVFSYAKFPKLGVVIFAIGAIGQILVRIALR